MWRRVVGNTLSISKDHCSRVNSCSSVKPTWEPPAPEGRANLTVREVLLGEVIYLRRQFDVSNLASQSNPENAI